MFVYICNTKFRLFLYLYLIFKPFGVFKECPKRNGYFSKVDGYACEGRDEEGWLMSKNPDECQKACDANPDCISFEIADNYCNLSSSCTYEVAHPEERHIARWSRSGQRACLYVKQGQKTLPYQAI